MDLVVLEDAVGELDEELGQEEVDLREEEREQIHQMSECGGARGRQPLTVLLRRGVVVGDVAHIVKDRSKHA